jgi:uncharacterized protein YceK
LRLRDAAHAHDEEVRMRSHWMVLALPAVLSGCASMMSSYSEVTGDRYNLAPIDRR